MRPFVLLKCYCSAMWLRVWLRQCLLWVE